MLNRHKCFTTIIRGVARPGVMVGHGYHFPATLVKAIFHAIRQYSQNRSYLRYSFQ